MLQRAARLIISALIGAAGTMPLAASAAPVGMEISAYTGFLTGASTSNLTLVPEPGVLLVFGIGMVALGTARRRGRPALRS